MTESLSGLRVLMLRSPRPGDPLAARLRSRGAGVDTLPLLRIEPRPLPDAALTEAAANADKWLFVSRHAVRHGLGQLAAAGLLRSGIPTFAVGAATAAALHDDWGITARYPPDANTEGLLRLPELQSVAGETILIFRGVGGRDALRVGLSARGARVRYCEVYARVPEPRRVPELAAALAAPGALLLVAHSGEVVRALAAAVARVQVLNRPLPACLVPGERVADIARRLGFAPVVAASALAAEMEQALCRWYTPERFRT